jgi:hypothetical protein
MSTVAPERSPALVPDEPAGRPGVAGAAGGLAMPAADNGTVSRRGTTRPVVDSFSAPGLKGQEGASSWPGRDQVPLWIHHLWAA